MMSVNAGAGICSYPAPEACAFPSFLLHHSPCPPPRSSSSGVSWCQLLTWKLLRVGAVSPPSDQKLRDPGLCLLRQRASLKGIACPPTGTLGSRWLVAGWAEGGPGLACHESHPELGTAYLKPLRAEMVETVLGPWPRGGSLVRANERVGGRDRQGTQVSGHSPSVPAASVPSGLFPSGCSGSGSSHAPTECQGGGKRVLPAKA